MGGMTLKNKQKTRRFKRYIRKQVNKCLKKIDEKLKEVEIKVTFDKAGQTK